MREVLGSLAAVRITASPEASRYIRERGGRLCMWLQDVGGAFGRLRVTTEPPRGAVDFESIAVGDFDAVEYDRRLAKPKRVEIFVRRWPWRRLVARGFPKGAAAGDGGGSGSAAEDDGGLRWWEGGGSGNGGGGNGGGNGAG